MSTQPALDVLIVARDFARRLLNEVGPRRLAEADRRNLEDEAYRCGACASHDFCDANVLMAEAMEAHLGIARGSFELELGDRPNSRLWSEAWDYASGRGFVRLACEASEH